MFYFKLKVIILDYEGYKIVVSNNWIDYLKLDCNKYVVFLFYRIIYKGYEDLFFFEGEYNNEFIIVYLNISKNYLYLYNFNCNNLIG